LFPPVAQTATKYDNTIARNKRWRNDVGGG